MLKALIFDVDGTLADTEMAHLGAFNHAFAEAGLDWRWDVPLYTKLLEISGGKERIRAYWESRGDMPKEVGHDGISQTIAQLHEIKTAAYEQAVQNGEVHMRPGVLALMRSAIGAGLHLAIATTTSPVNITNLLKQAMGPDWNSHFSVIEDASTAPRKKPDPSVYLQTLARLNLPASACIAIEDSANGLRAATAAGLTALITTNPFTEHHNFDGAFKVLPNLQGMTLSQLQAWHAQSTFSA